MDGGIVKKKKSKKKGGISFLSEQAMYKKDGVNHFTSFAIPSPSRATSTRKHYKVWESYFFKKNKALYKYYRHYHAY